MMSRAAIASTIPGSELSGSALREQTPARRGDDVDDEAIEAPADEPRRLPLAGVELLVGGALGVQQQLAQDDHGREDLDAAVDAEGRERHRARGDAGRQGDDQLDHHPGDDETLGHARLADKGALGQGECAHGPSDTPASPTSRGRGSAVAAAGVR